MNTRSKNFSKHFIGVSATMLIVALMVLPAMSTANKAPPSAAVATVNIGTAGNFVILAKSGITTTGTTAITGDIGVSPIAAGAMTGFGLVMDGTNTFATSTLVTGKVYAANYAAPTPAMLGTAVLDMEAAYTDAIGRTGATALGAGGQIGGLTLSAGLYNYGGVITLTGDVTLSGSSTDVWIFQMSGGFTVAAAARVVLTGGAQAKNVFWAVPGVASMGAGSIVNGIILSATGITMTAGAVLNGRALAQTAVTLISNTISMPADVKEEPDPTDDNDDVADDNDDDSSSESKIDGFPILASSIVLLGTVGLILHLKRKNY